MKTFLVAQHTHMQQREFRSLTWEALMTLEVRG